MKKLQRITSLLVALLMATSMFIGCDLDSSTSTETSTDNSKNTDDTPTQITPDNSTTYGIGYGYDITCSPYFDSEQIKKTSILDLKKIDPYLDKTQSTGSDSGGIYAESISEYSQKFTDFIKVKTDISGNWQAFSAGFSMQFEQDFVSSISTNQTQIFYTYYDNIKSSYMELKNYDIDTLRGMLSDLFVKAINRETSETQGLNDEQLAEYILNKFGSHLIVGVQLGGKIEYSYIIKSHNTEANSKIRAALDAQFNAGVSGLLSASESISGEGSLEQILKSNNIEKSIRITRSGGKSTGLWNEEELKKNYSEWAESLNDEKYTNAVGLTTDGLVAIWELIPSNNDYEGLKNALKNIFEENGEKNYNELIKKYAPTIKKPILEDVQDYRISMIPQNCNPDNGFDISQQGGGYDIKSHQNWHLLELVVGNCAKDQSGKYHISEDGNLKLYAKLLESPSSLPIKASIGWNWWGNKVNNDTYSGQIYGTNLQGQTVGCGAYYIKVNYNNGSYQEFNGTNFMYNASKDDMIPLNLNVDPTLSIKSIDIVFAYELAYSYYEWFHNGPRYSNWRCSTTLEFGENIEFN